MTCPWTRVFWSPQPDPTSSLPRRVSVVPQEVHAGIGMDVWVVDAQSARLIKDALAVDDELTLTVRPGTPQRFTRHQVKAT